MMNKLAVALFLSAAAVAVNGQEPGNPPCYICGSEFERVGLPDFVVEVPGQIARTCKEVEDAGLDGLISQAQCGFLPGIFATPCECEEIPEPATNDEPIPENLPETEDPIPVNPIEPVPEEFDDSDVPSDMPSLMPSGAPSVMTGEGGTEAPGPSEPSASMTVAGSAGAVAMAAVVAVFMM